MAPRPIKQNVSLALRIALIALSAAIFAWGLQYKLSLYETPSHPNPAKVAKLIQGDQSSKKCFALELQNHNRCPRAAAAHIVPGSQPPMTVRRNRPIDAPVLASIPFVPSILFVRPPPPIC